MAKNAQLVMTKGPQPEATFPLDEPTLVLGRDPRNAIVVDHPQVSRHHARITRRKDVWVLEDLESTNSTWVNGIRLVGPHVLATGDVIGLSEAVMLAFEGEKPEAPEARPEPSTRSTPQPPSPFSQEAPAPQAALEEPGRWGSPAAGRNRPSRLVEQAKGGSDRTGLWIGVGCAILLLIAACTAVLILGYLDLLPGRLRDLLSGPVLRHIALLLAEAAA
jgi:hypothetical protein